MKRILTLLTFLMQFNLAFTMSGSGTSGDPYLVTSASELNDVRNDLTAYYKQMNDITLSGEWIPIGTGNTTVTAFTGTYDGNGHKITGLTITGYSVVGAGLFGYNRGIIKNLGVSGTVSTTNGISGILAGANYYGTIQNCYTEGSISSSNNNVGGFVGACMYSTTGITQCYSTATVTATGTGSMNVGGFVGTTNSTSGQTISECYCTGNVSNSNNNSGNKANTGGFVGGSSLNISNCYATGSVTCSSGGERFGGFCGFASYSTPITDCYSTGAVTGTSTVKGGFVGYCNTGTFTSCFFDHDIAALSSYGGYATSAPTGITAKTTAQMKTPSTFTDAGWSTSVWSLVSGNYPILLWQIPANSIFTGTGNWSEAARWTNGLPGSTTDVTISGTCTVDADYTVAALTITNGYVLHIDPVHILTVSGTLANNAGATGLILESDATGTGMLMNNSTGVQASVEQYLKKYQWHFMGIPVTGIPDVSVPLHGCYVIWIDESDAYDALSTGWQYLASGNSMKVMGGYAVRFGWDASLFPKSVDTTVTFSGILNTGVQDTIFDSETEGWNFISNPYPVTLNWEGSGKTITNGNDAFYLWNPNLNSGTGSYGSYGSYVSGGSTNGQTQYIPPMQGFFFQVWATNAAISFDNTCKASISSAVFCDAGILHENEENIFRTEMAVPGTGIGEPYIKMAITSNGINYDETLIRVNDKATELFDGHYDAAKLKAIDTRQSQIYSVNDGIEYSINTLPEFSEKTVIPLRIMINETGKHMLTLKEMRNKLINCPLTLYDNNGKALANLSETIFNFEGQKGEIKSFYLGLGIRNAEEIVALHSKVETSLQQYSQLILRPQGQRAFAVQQRPAFESGSSIQSSIR